eukprot:688169-Alexandrium_andersonii.AAC.1
MFVRPSSRSLRSPTSASIVSSAPSMGTGFRRTSSIAAPRAPPSRAEAASASWTSRWTTRAWTWIPVLHLARQSSPCGASTRRRTSRASL